MQSPTPHEDNLHVVWDPAEERSEGPEACEDRTESRESFSLPELLEVRRMKMAAVEVEDYEAASRLKAREMELMRCLEIENENADAKPDEAYEEGVISLDADNTVALSQQLSELHPEPVLLCAEEAHALRQARTHAVLFEHYMQRAFPGGVPYTESEMLHNSAASTAGCLEDRIRFAEPMDEGNHERTFHHSDTADEREPMRKDQTRDEADEVFVDCDDPADDLLSEDDEEEDAPGQRPFAQEISEDCDKEMLSKIPLTSTGRLTSIGSVAHDRGGCQPCLLMNMSGGCPDGIKCEFCHFQHKKRKQRPCKGKRDRYRRLVDRLKEVVRADPGNFDHELNSVDLPSSIETCRVLKQKLKNRLLAEAALIQQEARAAEHGYPLIHHQHRHSERSHQSTQRVGTPQTQSSRSSYFYSGRASPPLSWQEGGPPHAHPSQYVTTYVPVQGMMSGSGWVPVDARMAMPSQPAQWAPTDWYIAPWPQASPLRERPPPAPPFHPASFQRDVQWVPSPPSPQQRYSPSPAFQPSPRPMYRSQQPIPGNGGHPQASGSFHQGIGSTYRTRAPEMGAPPGLLRQSESRVPSFDEDLPARRVDGDVPDTVRWLDGLDGDD